MTKGGVATGGPGAHFAYPSPAPAPLSAQIRKAGGAQERLFETAFRAKLAALKAGWPWDKASDWQGGVARRGCKGGQCCARDHVLVKLLEAEKSRVAAIPSLDRPAVGP